MPHQAIQPEAGQAGPGGLSLHGCGLQILAGCFALGLTLGWHSGLPDPWPWIAFGFVGCAGAAVLMMAGRWAAPVALSHAAVISLAVAAIGFGSAWISLRMDRVAPDDLTAWVDDEPRLLRVEGRALGSPHTRYRTGGSLARFDFRGPVTVVPVEVEALLSSTGERVPVTGRLAVRVAETVETFRAGDRVRAVGQFGPIDPPLNPGEFDLRTYAAAHGQAGWLRVPSRDLLEVEPAERPRWLDRWRDFREMLHQRAGAWLLTGIPGDPDRSIERDALLKAILLGQREPDLEPLAASFQRVGLAHLLAISGLHLGILAGMVLLLLRMGGHWRAWHISVVIGVVLLYLLLVEVRMPVLRAGIMTIAACLGLMLDRRLWVSNLVALSAIGLLLWRPEQLFLPGFQLSFGVVLGLIHLSPIVRARMFRRPPREVYEIGSMVAHRLRDAGAVAVTAWLVATPIVIYHFGIFSPLGIPLSVVGVPIVAGVLALGYAKLVLEVVLPSVAYLISVPLAALTEMFITTVQAIDALPFASVPVPFPGLLWTLAALGVVTAVVVHRGRTARRAVLAAVCALSVWLIWPWLPTWIPGRDEPALRVDMIAVGHGACFVLRSEGRTFVFDAGSLDHLDAGRQWIIPALRRLGVRSIDAIAISHPHIDHYSAVIELVDEFGTDRVLVTHQFIEHAREHPDSPVAYAADALSQRLVTMQPKVTGDIERLGAAEMTWLHPPKNLEEFGRDNEHSMVIRVDVGPADRTMLLTGDVERAGLAGLLGRKPDLRVDVIEIPHHGAYTDLAAALMDRADPAIALQSTGWFRWRRDQWVGRLGETPRMVTIRDGASWVEFHAGGRITAGAFRRPSKTIVIED